MRRPAEAKRNGRILWIRKEKVFTRFDYGLAEQRCRELHLDGLCGDLREMIRRLLRLFFITILLGYAPGNARLLLDGAQEHLAA